LGNRIPECCVYGAAAFCTIYLIGFRAWARYLHILVTFLLCGLTFLMFDPNDWSTRRLTVFGSFLGLATLAVASSALSWSLYRDHFYREKS
jgi:hypothetical protein